MWHKVNMVFKYIYVYMCVHNTCAYIHTLYKMFFFLLIVAWQMVHIFHEE